jgi:hypothetical protein
MSLKPIKNLIKAGFFIFMAYCVIAGGGLAFIKIAGPLGNTLRLVENESAQSVGTWMAKESAWMSQNKPWSDMLQWHITLPGIVNFVKTFAASIKDSWLDVAVILLVLAVLYTIGAFIFTGKAPSNFKGWRSGTQGMFGNKHNTFNTLAILVLVGVVAMCYSWGWPEGVLAAVKPILPYAIAVGVIVVVWNTFKNALFAVGMTILALVVVVILFGFSGPQGVAQVSNNSLNVSLPYGQLSVQAAAIWNGFSGNTQNLVLGIILDFIMWMGTALTKPSSGGPTQVKK